jgi:hypothetical protein
MTRYWRSLLATTMISAAALAADLCPAAAQSSIACSFGPERYRDCCTDSYRQKPRLGARARADDIDACMNRPRQKAVEQKPRSQNPPTEKNLSVTETETGIIRRINCSGGACSTGCGSNEMPISAFCEVGFFPTPLAERSIQCFNGSQFETPTVLFCAKK